MFDFYIFYICVIIYIRCTQLRSVQLRNEVLIDWLIDT